MSTDIRTFEGFKNWLLIGAAGVIITLLGLIATDNRRRIEIVETHVEERGPVLVSLSTRITAIESRLDTQQAEVFRRLERIEHKLDQLQ